MIKDYCEVMSADARSNQVVYSCFMRLEWISKPWLIDGIIEHVFWNRVEEGAPISKAYISESA